MRKTSVLILRLEGPLQSWGSHSKWDYRATDIYPTKSGVVGLLGCALGFEKDDNRICELADNLTMAIRADRPGIRIVDYQTVTGSPLLNAEGKKRSGSATFISRHEYLSDASFMVALEGPVEIIHTISEALRHPKWLCYLGRKNCVPSRPILESSARAYSSLPDALRHHPPADGASAEGRYACESEYPLANEGVITRSDLPAGDRRFRMRKVYRGMVEYVSEQA